MDPSQKFCCTPGQLDILASGLGLLRSLIDRCPSCSRNFGNLWCHFTCNPNQHKFVKVVELRVGPHGKSSKPSVKKLKFSLDLQSATGLYDSCKNIQNPSIGKSALLLFCGEDMKQCGASTMFFSKIGQMSRLQKPWFSIDFELINKNQNDHASALSFDITACNKFPDNTSAACSCMDCPAACLSVQKPYPDVKQGEKSCNIFMNFSCLEFLSFFLLALVTLITSAYFAGNFLLKQKQNCQVPTSSVAEKKKMKYSFLDSVNFGIEIKLKMVSEKWAMICLHRPFWVIALGLTVAVACSSGLYKIQFTTDPVELWSAPSSQARKQKEIFDQSFGPFYRTEQLIIVPNNQTNFKVAGKSYGPALRYEFLLNVLELQKQIERLVAKNGEHNVTLNDICFKPLNKSCAVMSVLNYFQHNNDTFHSLKSGYIQHIEKCSNCFGDYGGPIYPYVVFGGYPRKHYTLAKALVITYVVTNTNNSTKNKMAEAWEKEFLNLLHHYSKQENLTFDISFSTERSIQDEIERESHSDVFTVLLSYGIMFLYVTIALGEYGAFTATGNVKYIFLNSKILLALAGVVIVLLSVTSSIGFYSYCNIPATLIVIEVQPFLMLTVGVDNIFILVQAYQRDRAEADHVPYEQRFVKICGDMVPSMLLCSLSQCVCFFLGALSQMPAVKVFSLYAALAICINFFLQVTCFLALFVMDMRREEAFHLELFCCKQVKPSHLKNSGFLVSIFRNHFTPLLMFKPIRFLLNSYVLEYFEAMEEYLSVGPPVYFVVNGKYDFSQPEFQNRICGISGCNEDSLSGQIYSAHLYKNRSFIAEPASNWLDDYINWLVPLGQASCCKKLKNDSKVFCPSSETKITICAPCNVSFIRGRPVPNQFYNNIHGFLSDNPNEHCTKGGHAAYSTALYFPSETQNNHIQASYFMTYHTVLKTTEDFIAALKNAKEISANLTEQIQYGTDSTMVVDSVTVFPYSVFYVFYEQYLTIVRDAVLQLSISLAAIFLVSLILFGLDIWSSALNSLCIAMILLNLIGFMYWWNISLNAVSLVNLVMAVGISVEFCSHVTLAFVRSSETTRTERATEALNSTGTSVFGGITLTNGGIVVLAFAHSQIFQIFYFRMFMGIVLVGASHGLIFLPVLLSLAGPGLNRKRFHEHVDTNVSLLGTLGPAESAQSQELCL